MDFIRFKARAVFLAAGFLFCAQAVFSTIGIGTKFSTIVMEKLEIGGVYNVTQLRKLPLIIVNSGSADTEVVVEIEAPSKEELKDGYEPIFDPAWVKITPNNFALKAGEEYSCDLIVSIPDDKNLIGKHYMAKIWTHTGGEDSFGAGVVNRLFFSVGVPGPESLQKAKRKELLINLNFDTDPRDIYLEVAAGKKVDFMKELEKSIKLINKGRDTITLKLESVKLHRSENVILPVPSGYEFTPDIKLVSFKPEKIKVKGNSIKDAKLFLEVPDNEMYYGKKYMFLVRVFPVKPEIPIEFYTRVLVTINKPSK